MEKTLVIGPRKVGNGVKLAKIVNPSQANSFHEIRRFQMPFTRGLKGLEVVREKEGFRRDRITRKGVDCSSFLSGFTAPLGGAPCGCLFFFNERIEIGEKGGQHGVEKGSVLKEKKKKPLRNKARPNSRGK